MHQLPKSVSHMGEPIVSKSHQEYLEKHGMVGNDHLFDAVEAYCRSHVDDLVGPGGSNIHADRVLMSIFGRVPLRTPALPVITPKRHGMGYGLSIEVKITLSGGDPELLLFSPRDWNPSPVVRGVVDLDAALVTGTFETSKIIHGDEVECVVRWYLERVQDLCDAHASWLGDLRSRSSSTVANAVASCREAWVSSRDSEAYIQRRFSIRSPESAYDYLDDDDDWPG